MLAARSILPHELQGGFTVRVVRRFDARCDACDAALLSVFEHAADAWAERHETDQAYDDADALHSVSVTPVYSEIALSDDHARYFRRWASDIRADFKRYARRNDIFRFVGEAL